MQLKSNWAINREFCGYVMHLDDTQTGTTSITSLQLAEERTALALVRTGFSAAAFGAGMTQLVGRGTWPDGGVDMLTIVFVLAGAVSVQVGLNRLQRQMKKTASAQISERPGQLMLIVGVYLLQAALAMIIFMTLLHSG